MMMLRERLHWFLVAALLGPITSEQSSTCSICGDGFEVGSPFAKASVRCPDQTSCTCIELALAGLQGSIPMGQCSIISSVIFTTCDCQENTTQKTWFPELYPSNAPIAPPVFNFLPTNFVNNAPVAPTEYPSSSTNTFAPIGTQQGGYGKPEYAYFVILAPFAGFFGIVCLMDYLTGSPICWGLCSTQRSLQPIPIAELRHNREAIGEAGFRQRLGTIGVGDARSRRPLVLAALFPEEGRLETTEGFDGERRNLTYDPQSKQYVFCEDPPNADSCSICMECLVPTDDSVTGLCSHTYHRECIMNWLQDDHDDCPNCRQPMWDPETYKMIDESINDQEWHGP